MSLSENQMSLPDTMLPFYVTGGTLPTDSASYIKRAADKELLEALQRGELCYVLNARQMGKSSLSVRTRQALEAAGTKTTFLDLQKFGSSATPEQWYRALLERMGSDFKLRPQFLAYWRDNAELPPLTRVFNALREVALTQLPGKLVVFVDETDAVRSMKFETDEFFAAIRQCHNARVEDAAFTRLTFCIIGTVAPSDLIRDVRLSPFNIGFGIRLADFTHAEAAPLAAPLPGGTKTLERVLWWTSGHPYLTQRLCAELTKSGSSDVDTMVGHLFFSKSEGAVDGNIKEIREVVLRLGGEGTSFSNVDLLTRYRGIVSGERVADDDTDAVCMALRLSGLVRSEGGFLKPRCRVYAHVFDGAWVYENLPKDEARRQQDELRRQKAAVAKARWQIGSIAAAVLLAMGGLTTFAMASRNEAIYAQKEAQAAQARAVVAVKAEEVAKKEALRQANEARRQAKTATEAKKQAQVALKKVSAANKTVRIASEKVLTALSGERKAKLLALENAKIAKINEGRAIKQKNIAEKASFDLLIANKKSKENEEIAINQTKVALNLKETADKLLYVSNCNLIKSALDVNNFFLIDQYIEDTKKIFENNPNVEYGYEWVYLNEIKELNKSVLSGEFGHVRTLNMAKNGSCIIIGSFNGSIYIFDVDSKILIHRLQGHTREVLTVNVSLDGKRIVSGSADNTAIIWDIETGNVIRKLEKHTDNVVSACFSVEGDYIVTGSDDKSAIVWDCKTGDAVKIIKHPRGVHAVCFSPDSQYVLTGCDDTFVRVCEMKTDNVKKLEGHRGDILSICFSPDKTKFVTASVDGTAIVWNETTKFIVGTLKGHNELIIDVKFSDDGSKIVTSSHDDTVIVWDANNFNVRNVLKGHRGNVYSACFLKNDSLIATAGSDGTIRIWSAELTGDHLPLRGHSAEVYTLDYSPDGLKLVTGSKDHTLKIWDTVNGRLLLTLADHSDSVNCVTFSPDGKQIASGSSDNTGKVWDVKTGKPIFTLLRHTDKILSICYSKNGEFLITGSKDKTVCVWNAYTGEFLFVLDGYTDSVNSVCSSPDSRLIATADDDGLVKIWDLLLKTEVKQFKENGSLRSINFSPDGKSLVTAHSNNSASIWDVKSGALIGELKGHRDEVMSACFSPDGQRILTGSEDGTIRLWDVATRREILQLKNPSPSGVVPVVRFSPDGEHIASGSYDPIARIWRKITDAQLDEYQRQTRQLAEAPELLATAEQNFRSADNKEASVNFAELARRFQTPANPWSGLLPNLIEGDVTAYRQLTLAKQPALGQKLPAADAAVIARRAAITPKLVEDYSAFVSLGKQASDEVEKRIEKPEANDDMIIYSYGAILLRAGKTAEAIVQLEKAAKLKPDRIWPIQFLVLAYIQSGDKELAQKWFDKSEVWRTTEMDKQFPGPQAWSARLQVLLLWRECKQVLGIP